MPHILIAGKIHDDGLAVLRNAPGVSFDLVPEVTVEAYRPHVHKAEAILIRTQPLTAEIIAEAPNLKIVSRHGVGFDTVDGAALAKRNIPLCIVGDVNSRAVAEHTLMLMLAASRRIVAHDSAVRSGNWNERNTFNSGELDGKTLLVVGLGRIGRRVAELARAFGMAIIAYDPFVPSAPGITMVQNLDDALAQADVVSLHMPASKDGPLIGYARLAKMKAGSILVNAARGELVDEQALVQALDSGHLRHAAIDVLREEPPRPGHPLLGHPRVTISPHNAGLTTECAARMAVSSAQNILDFFAGKLDPKLVVNSPQA